MIGRVDNQLSFSDFWLEGKIADDSYWNVIRIWAMKFLNDNIFEPLFSKFGRTSVPPIYTFLAILIQLDKLLSDTEVEEASRFDDRFKYAITALRDFEGIDAVTLHDHRKRFFESEVGQQIFNDLLKKAKSMGLFNSDNISVIDSFMVYGASAKQDTYTMTYLGIKKVLMYCRFNGIYNDAKSVLKRTDYDNKRKKPEIDWTNDKEKEVLLDGLVKDALALVNFIKTKKVSEDLVNARELLEKVASQDVKLSDNGNYEMVDGTAKDRIISINDPEMRHGRKTSSKLKDGYKAEIITGGDNSQFVVSVALDGANTPDGEYFDQLVTDAKDRIDAKKVYGDCAYSDYEVIKKHEEEIEFFVRVTTPINKNGKFTKEEFEINIDAGTVKCPCDELATFDPSKIDGKTGTTAKFSFEKCEKCPKYDECTSSKSGRSISINKDEDRLQNDREIQKSQEFKAEYNKRSNGERTIAFLTRSGGRKSKYIGKEKTKWQLTMIAINNNIKQLMKHVFSSNAPKTGELCLKMS